MQSLPAGVGAARGRHDAAPVQHRHYRDFTPRSQGNRWTARGGGATLLRSRGEIRSSPQIDHRSTGRPGLRGEKRMHPPFALFNLGFPELVILAVFGLFALVVPLTVGIVLWAVF